MKKIKMTMDNGSCNNFDKLTIEAEIDTIEYEAKKFFNWRSSTKQYESIYRRVGGLGTSQWDSFILHMHKIGYGLQK